MEYYNILELQGSNKNDIQLDQYNIVIKCETFCVFLRNVSHFLNKDIITVFNLSIKKRQFLASNS